MTMASWIASKLRESEYDAQEVGPGGVLISDTEKHGDVLIHVIEASSSPLKVNDLSQILAAHPDCQAIVTTRGCSVGVGFVEAAADAGILVAKLGHLTRALESAGDIGTFLHPDEEYLISRLKRSRHVSDVIRIGTQAWRVERPAALDLEIITHGRYEFPVGELYDLLEAHPGLAPDAFVITNPYSRGLSARVKAASEDVGIDVYLLNDFFGRLASP